jgi:hypothetical protein
MRTPEATDAPDSLPQHRKKREGIEGGSYTMGYTHSHAAISPRYYYRLSKGMVTFSWSGFRVLPTPPGNFTRA